MEIICLKIEGYNFQISERIKTSCNHLRIQLTMRAGKIQISQNCKKYHKVRNIQKKNLYAIIWVQRRP